MRNFVFISPNFPASYWLFCQELKDNGMNVLGVGDCPYDQLTQQQKDSMNEYYKVSTLENYDEVFKAVAFFSYKYGKIDWLESNNEYWLERDARLRTDFNITTGFHNEDIAKVKYKSKMKEYYIKAGVPVARYHIVDDYEGCAKFIEEVGYPVITKPDNGVGASHTFKIKNDEDLKVFFKEKWENITYIMEEFITGEICSYDAIIGPESEPLFETGNITPTSLMDVVNNGLTSVFYIQKNLPEDTKAAGRATVKAFGVKSRFVHFEFFRLTEDQHIGKKGDVVALEVNMRPSGGVSPDMMNFANSTSVYKIWADMIAYGKSTLAEGNHYYAAFVGRRDNAHYYYSAEDIREMYKEHIKMDERVQEALAGAMGDYMFVCNFDNEDELKQYYIDTCKTY